MEHSRKPANDALAVTLVVTTLGCVLGAAFAALRGTDVNWDFLNYHHYVAFLLLNQRLDLDIIPAQIQTYSTPLAYIPHYWLVTHLPPIIAGALLGAFHGLNAGLTFVLAKELIPGDGLKTYTALLCALVGTSAPLFLSEVGTSFADVTTSLLILASLLLVLQAVRRALPAPLMLGSGLLIGLAVGLKLTNAVFLIGLSLTLLAATAPWRNKLRSLMVFAGSAALGGVLVTAHWGWMLWQKFHNPIFPFYNGIFKSPYYPLENFRDARFLPKSPVEAVSYPFQWAIGLHPSCEIPFQDARFAVLVLLLLALGLAFAVSRLRGRRHPEPTSLDKQPSRLVLVFFTSSALVWLAMFSIQRYIVALELLSGVAMLACLTLLLESRAMRVSALSVLAAITVVTTQVPDWGHVRWSRHWVEIAPRAVALPANAVYVMTSGYPFAYVIPYMPAGSRFLRIDGNFVVPAVSPLGGQISEVLSRHAGEVFVMQPAGAGRLPASLLAGYGLAVSRLFTTIDTPAAQVEVYKATVQRPAPGETGEASGR